jgi:integrase
VGGAGTGIQVKAWKGSWWIFVNHHGQRKAKRVGTGKEGQKTAVAAEKIQARLVLGDLSLLEEAKPQEITLREYAEQWLTTDVALRQKPGTVETYRGVLRNHWLPELGTLPLSAITRVQIKSILQRKLMAGMKANMARSMFGVLRTCLNAAVEEERIMGTPRPVRENSSDGHMPRWISSLRRSWPVCSRRRRGEA